MKRLATAICIALSFALAAQAQVKELNVSKRFNWGIRLGVNAPLVDIRHMSLDGNQIDESDSESSLGLTGSFIGRYNFKRHYIQLEVGMHQSHTRLYNPDYGLSKIKKHCTQVDTPEMGDIIVTRFRDELHVAVYYEYGKIIHVFRDHTLQIGRLKLFRDYLIFRVND